jgi:hypothetical protein
MTEQDRVMPERHELALDELNHVAGGILIGLLKIPPGLTQMPAGPLLQFNFGLVYVKAIPWTPSKGQAPVD